MSDSDRRRRLDPLVGGISIGSPSTPVGTLGALVWDKTDGTICILSNRHVLAGNPHAEAGSPCFQPGRFDRGTSTDVVARLKRWSFDNETDAAIARKVRIAGMFPADSHAPVSYPVAAVAKHDTPAARAFLRFLDSAQASAVFRRYGFTVR